MSVTSVHDCVVVQLDRTCGAHGSLVSVRGGVDVPFDIARVYYLYEVPADSARGGHAHRALRQLIVAASGAFDIVLDDGRERQRVRLDRPDAGLLMPPMIWRELDAFTSDAVCLVLASAWYDEADYIRDLQEFRAAKEA